MERCIREAKAVAKVFLERVAILISPLRRERRQQGTLSWTRTTRSGARGLLVDSVACAVAMRVVDEVGVEENVAGAAARSRRARTKSRPKKCLFGPGLDLMEWLCKMNKILTISAECAFERTLRFPRAGSSHQRFFFPQGVLEPPRTSYCTIAVVSGGLGSTRCEAPNPFLVVSELRELVFQLERAT